MDAKHNVRFIACIVMLVNSQVLLYGQGCGMLCNTDFENNTISGIYPTNVHDSLVQCWSTTAPDSLFEIWPASNYESVPVYSGSNFIELNANFASSLYQTFSVNPGTNINITFAHRGRLGTDQMKVEFGNAGGPYTLLGNYSTGTTWTLYSINYVVPATASGPQELRFSSVSTSTGNPTVGNFLDAINVSYVISGTFNSVTGITCNGGSDGAIDVSAVGGFPPLTYSMGGSPQANGIFTNLSSGSNVVTMTDSNGCSYDVDTVLSEPPPVLIDTISLTPTTCGYLNGAIELYADSGLSPYQYSIDGGSTWQSGGMFTGLDSGSYTIVVTDANLCANTAVFYVPEIVSTDLTISNQSDISCNGGNDGEINVAAFGGSAPYIYDIGTGAQTTGSFNNLSPGNYTIVVTDDNGCSTQINTSLTEPSAPLSVSSVIIDETCYGNCSGSVQISASGGTPPYNYSLDSGTIFSSDSLYNSLCSGIYYVIVVDSNGCQYSDTINVGGPIEIIADFDASPSFGLGPLDVNMTNNSSGATDYVWDFMDGGSSTLTDPTHIFTEGIYNVMLIAFNGPCSDTTYKKIVVTSESILIVPNIITINGDGLNDVFEMITYQNIIDFECKIFNRWGQLIYAFNNVGGHWDGTNRNGEYVADGTYFYTIGALGGDGVKYRLSGHITALVTR